LPGDVEYARRRPHPPLHTGKFRLRFASLTTPGDDTGRRRTRSGTDSHDAIRSALLKPPTNTAKPRTVKKRQEDRAAPKDDPPKTVRQRRAEESSRRRQKAAKTYAVRQKLPVEGQKTGKNAAKNREKSCQEKKLKVENALDLIRLREIRPVAFRRACLSWDHALEPLPRKSLWDKGREALFWDSSLRVKALRKRAG